MPDHTIHNERMKLTANYLNGIALAVLGVGAFAPLVAFLYGTSNMTLPAWVVPAGFVICVFTSFGLHWAARHILGRMRT